MNSLRVCVCLLLVVPVCASASAPRPPLRETAPEAVGVSTRGLERLHELLRRSVAAGEHAGFVTILARDGKIADWHTVGVRDVGSGAPMKRDTIFRIYSMTKIVTAVALMSLVEEGRLSLDDPLAKFLPEFAQPQVIVGGTAEKPELEPAKGAITIRHLLTHTGGLSYDFLEYPPVTDLYKRADLWSAPSLDEFVGRASRLPLKTHPGTEFSYSIGPDLLGAVVEKVSGTSFERFLQRRIFDPLGMRDTGFDVPAKKIPRLAVLSRHGADGQLLSTEPILGAYAEPERGFASGGAGLFSTAGDYVRFAQMLANGGELDGARILKPATIERMRANELAGLKKPTHDFSEMHGWGLGFEVELDPRIASFGWCGAATTYVRICPKERTVMLLFAQHLPFNEHGIFAPFVQACRAALEMR